MDSLTNIAQNPSETAKRGLFVLVMLALAIISSAQSEYHQVYDQSLKINNTGMIVLGSWAITNIAIGVYGWSNFTGQRKYFHQMNALWNVVNISIAGYALYSNMQTHYSDWSTDELLKKMVKTENLYLINGALDIAYIGTGVLLRHLSLKSEKSADLLGGYAKSLILQGGFLLFFDLVMYGVLKTRRSDFMDDVYLSLLPEINGISVYLKF